MIKIKEPSSIQNNFEFPLKDYLPVIAQLPITLNSEVCNKYKGIKIRKPDNLKLITDLENRQLAFQENEIVAAQKWLTSLAGTKWFPEQAFSSPLGSCIYTESIFQIKNKLENAINNKQIKKVKRILKNDSESLRELGLFQSCFGFGYGGYSGEDSDGEHSSTTGFYIEMCGVTAYSIPLTNLPIDQALAITGWLNHITQELELLFDDSELEGYWLDEYTQYTEKQDDLLAHSWLTNSLPEIQDFCAVIDENDLNYMSQMQFGCDTFLGLPVESQKDMMTHTIGFLIRQKITKDSREWTVNSLNCIPDSKFRTFLKQSYRFMKKYKKKFSGIIDTCYGHLDPNWSVHPHYSAEGSILEEYEQSLSTNVHTGIMNGDEESIAFINIKHPHIKDYLISRQAGQVFLTELLTYLP
jgi:hypothetical protein